MGLTLHGLRHLDHGREVEMVNRRQHRAHRIGRRTPVYEIGIPGLELADLAVGAPLPVSVASVSQIGSRDPLEATTFVEPRGDFERESLIVNKAVITRRP